MRIRTRFLISFLVVALVPLIAASALFLVLGRSTIRDQALKSLQAVAAIQKQRVEHRLEMGQQQLAQAKSQTHLLENLQAYVANPNPLSRDEITRTLADEVSALKSFKNMSVLDLNGRVITSTDPSLVGKDESQSTYFLRGQDTDDVSVFNMGPGGQLEEYLTGPVEFDGRKLGVLAIESSADDFTALMKDYTGLGKTGETVVAEKTPAGGARFLGPTRFGKQEPLSNIVPGEKSNVPINVALSGKTEILTGSADYRGKPVLAATEYIKDPLLGIVVKMDQSEAYSALNKLLALIGGVFGVAVVLVIVTALLLSRSITGPIIALTETAGAISGGDLARRAQYHRDDEVGELAVAFNKMTDDLVAEREGLERKVEERTAELAVSNIELDGYAHTVSHDLRGPISSISMSASLLSEILDEEDVVGNRAELKTLADQILTSTDRSFSLITDLLALAEAGHKPSTVESVDLDETVQRIIMERADRIKGKNARVEVVGKLGSILASPTQMYLLFNNLIVNAVKHNDAAEPLVEVVCLGAAEGGGRKYQVRDNGPGIAEGDFDRIFEPFFKGRGGETGIGLATVKKIVETYRGEITPCNMEGGGACFELVLHDYDRGQGQDLE
jgi:signal transduction histidine kinase